jgi:hypothetical protein
VNERQAKRLTKVKRMMLDAGWPQNLVDDFVAKFRARWVRAPHRWRGRAIYAIRTPTDNWPRRKDVLVGNVMPRFFVDDPHKAAV